MNQLLILTPQINVSSADTNVWLKSKFMRLYGNECDTIYLGAANCTRPAAVQKVFILRLAIFQRRITEKKKKHRAPREVEHCTDSE